MLALLLSLLAPAHAADIELTVQTRLTDSQGTAIDGSHTIDVRLWKDASDTSSASLLWDKRLSNQSVDGGFFHYILGADDSGDAVSSDWFTSDVWVSFEVDDGGEMQRTRLVHVPKAGLAESAAGVVTEGAASSSSCSTLGAMRWDTSVDALRVCDGSQWVYLGGGGVGSTSAGVIAYYPFDGSLEDAGDGGYDLTPSGSPTTNTLGKYDRAFVGNNDDRATTTILALSGVPSFTMAGWVRIDALTPQGSPSQCGEGIFGIGNTTMSQHLFVRVNNGGCGWANWSGCDVPGRVGVGADRAGVDTWQCGGPAVNDGQWHHVAVTYHGPTGGLRLYVDGVLGRSDAITGLNLDGVLWIGGDDYDDNFLDGGLDDVIIYDDALTSSQVAALAQSSGPAGLPPIMANPDFENGMTGWSGTGTAFASWPQTSCANAGPCFGTAGISTRIPGESTTGVLTSSPFRVTYRYLCWQAGGFGPSYTAVDIGNDGSEDVVQAALGTDGNGGSGDTWGEQCVDLQAYIGQEAVVKLIDNDAGSSFSWIAWDSFSVRDSL